MHPIEQYRKEHNLGLGELAKRLNRRLPKKRRKLNDVRLCQYISGNRRPSPELAQVMAKELGVSIEEILFPKGNGK